MAEPNDSLINTTVVPPIAPKIAKTDVLHGETRVDNYYWLRDKTNPQVLDYLNKENAYTEVMMKSTEGLQKTIYDEIITRTKQTDLSVPYRYGNYFYYSRTEEGKQYSIQCRKPKSLDAPEEVVLDLNKLAEGHKFLGLGLYQVSDDGNLLAYSLDTTGFRQYQSYFKNLATGETLPDQVGQINSGEWCADNKTFYYVKEDAAKRPFQLYKHVLGSPKDELIFEEKDELFNIWIDRSSDKKYLFLAAGSKVATEYRFLRADQPGQKFTLMYRRDGEHEYYPDHRGNLFYIRTNKNAKNFKLVVVPDADLALTGWKELSPYRSEVKLESVLLFKDFLVYYERENALTRFRVVQFATNNESVIAFPDQVYTASPGANAEFDVAKFRYNYQSFITPSSVYDYDMTSGKQELLKRTEVLGGYDPTQYLSERRYAKSRDGVLVPISLVYKKGTTLDGTAPMLLYGYGSYGIPMNASFSIPRLSLIGRGVIYALAHIRGGGDLGEQWYDDGKMLKKKNTFNDFIDCADYLVAEKYTSHNRLAIQGGSAGGLLIGAVLNMRPDLCKAAHMAVPFVDVINSMLDETLPLTVGEFLEWGNPKVKAEYDYMKSYSPYDNLDAKAFPDLLVTTSLNDSQVMYWEPAKYTARIRSMKSGGSVFLLKCNMGAGHGGSSGRYDAFKETAFQYAFLLRSLAITK